jgi:hypothetical protein
MNKKVKQYTNDLCKVLSVSSMGNNILNSLLDILSKDNEIILNSTIKNRLCSQLNIKEQGLNNGISKLKQIGLINHLGRGTYKLNPIYFSDTDWRGAKEVQAIWTYKNNGRFLSNLFIKY